MRKFFFCLIVALGGGIGILPALGADGHWGAGLILMLFGIVLAAPIAALITGVGRGRNRYKYRRRRSYGAGFSSIDGSVSDGAVRPPKWEP